jgi:hypothetical protein
VLHCTGAIVLHPFTEILLPRSYSNSKFARKRSAQTKKNGSATQLPEQHKHEQILRGKCHEPRDGNSTRELRLRGVAERTRPPAYAQAPLLHCETRASSSAGLAMACAWFDSSAKILKAPCDDDAHMKRPPSEKTASSQ